MGKESFLLVSLKEDKAKKDDKSKKFSPVFAFADMAKNHMEKHGTTIDQLAMVSVKSHYNASLNPNAQFQKAVTLEDVHNARMVADPLTVMHCCPLGDGAAAVVLCAKDVASKYTDKVCPTVEASILRSVLPDGDPTFSLTKHTANLLDQHAILWERQYRVQALKTLKAESPNHKQQADSLLRSVYKFPLFLCLQKVWKDF